MTRRWTLDDDRRMLDEARTLPTVSWDDYMSALRERFGVAYVDQLEAATEEAGRLGLLPPYPHHTRSMPVEFNRLLFAGITRCLASDRCEHALAGDRPLTAFLAARVVACDRCLFSFLNVLAVADARIADGADRLCDFCLQEPPDGHFRAVVTHYGPARVVGDICGSCFATAQDGI